MASQVKVVWDEYFPWPHLQDVDYAYADAVLEVDAETVERWQKALDEANRAVGEMIEVAKAQGQRHR